MSVVVYRRAESGGMDFLPAESPSDELGWVESMRKAVWGSPLVARLGLTLLPQLSHTYGIYAETPHELDALEAEARLVLEHADEVTAATHYDLAYLEVRIGNIVRAVQRARSLGACVVIW
jgi:hypothetical protein